VATPLPVAALTCVPTPQGCGRIGRHNQGDEHPIVIKSGLHAEFACAKLPKKFFKHLSKVQGGPLLSDRRAHDRALRPSVMMHQQSVTIDNIWDNSDSEDEFGQRETESRMSGTASSRREKSAPLTGQHDSVKQKPPGVFGRIPSNGGAYGCQPSEQNGPSMTQQLSERRRHFLGEVAAFVRSQELAEVERQIPENRANAASAQTTSKRQAGACRQGIRS